MLWLAAFVAPTVYVVLLLVLDNLQVPPPSELLVVSLLVVIPIAALLLCLMVVWRSKMGFGWRVGGSVFTVMALLAQCGVLVIVIASAIFTIPAIQ